MVNDQALDELAHGNDAFPAAADVDDGVDNGIIIGSLVHTVIFFGDELFQDVGKIRRHGPALAEAQVHGGMSMGIGFGMSEKLLFDPKTGRALNNNLLDYKLSTFMDHPRLRAYFVENPEPTSAFGTKSLGEPPTCPVAPAIRNAVYQATGVAVNDAPVNPHILFKRFKEEGLF